MNITTKIVALCTSALLAVGLGAIGVSAAHATNPNEGTGVCENLDTGHLNGTENNTLVYTAPEGKLVDYYCVKAGSVNQGGENGPVIVPVDPNTKTVTIDHPTKDSISHFSVKWIDAPTEQPITVRVNLTYMMDCAPDPKNTWRVRNPHTETITVSWRNASNTLSGTHQAAPGDTTFETPRGTETMIISWGGGNTGIVAGSVTKASGNDVPASDPKCAPPTFDPTCTTVTGAQTVEGTGIITVPGGWAESYITVPFTGTLADIGTVLNIEATPLQYVGLHIVTAEGTIVFEEEPTYDGKLWSQASWAGVNAGMGYPAFGTIEEFIEQNGDVQVTEIRLLYTHPEASSTTVTSFTIGCTTYTFLPPIPEKPETEVDYGNWVTGEYECGDTTVTETREVYTTTYTLVNRQWVGNTVTTNEERTRDLTAEEIEALECPVDPEPTPTPTPPVVTDPPAPDKLATTGAGFNTRGMLVGGIIALVLIVVGVLALLWKRHNERS